MLVVTRSYDELASELHPRHWLTGASSELLRFDADPGLCIKRFKPEWTQSDVRVWAETAGELAQWVRLSPGIARLLHAPELLELGRDYVLRRFVSLGTALSDFARFPAGAPPQLRELRIALEPLLPKLKPRVAAAARHTLLENCSTVFWDSVTLHFVLAEPRMTLAEARQ